MARIPREEPMLLFKSEGILLTVSSCSGEVNLLIYSGLENDWMRPTHIIKGNVFYSKSTDLNVNVT